MRDFEQWLLEIANSNTTPGEPEPSDVQKKATVDAKDVAAKTLQKQPEIVSTLTSNGPHAKKAQTKLSADVSTQLAKTAGNDVDPTKAAFTGVNDVIGDIEDSIEKPSMMKKRMKKK